eukprot:6213393-Pleurochrysis_carterae.AAC.3
MFELTVAAKHLIGWWERTGGSMSLPHVQLPVVFTSLVVSWSFGAPQPLCCNLYLFLTVYFCAIPLQVPHARASDDPHVHRCMICTCRLAESVSSSPCLGSISVEACV